MLVLIALVFSAYAETCREWLDRPVDLTGIVYDRSELRAVTAELEDAERTLEALDAQFDRAATDLAAARAHLTHSDRLFAWTGLSPRARLAASESRRRDRARIARTIAGDEVGRLRWRRDMVLKEHPTFHALLGAGARAFSAKCDSETCLDELATLALRLERSGAVESGHVERVLERAREALYRTSALYERLMRVAGELGLDVPVATRAHSTLDGLGAGAPLALTATELAHLQMRVRHLDVQLRDLQTEIRARLDAYLLYALEH